MGRSYSAPLPRPTSECPYFVLVIRPSKAIVLIFADENVKQIVGSRLRRSWHYGLKGEDGCAMSDGSYEFILKGTPFSGSADEELSARIGLLFTNLLADLKTEGWNLINSTKDLSQPTAGSACSTLFFHWTEERQMRGPVTNDNEIICMCSAGAAEPSNTLLIINTPEDLLSDLVALIEPRGSCKLTSTIAIGNEPTALVSSVQFEQQFWGDCETVYSRRCILQIFTHLHSLGYRFYGAINFLGTSDAVYFERASFSGRNVANGQEHREAIVEEEEEADDEESYREDADLEESLEMDKELRLSCFYGRPANSSSSASSSASTSSSGVRYFIIDAYKNSSRLRVVRAPLRTVFVIRSLISLRWPYGLRSVVRVDVDAYDFIIGTEFADDEVRKNTNSGNSAVFICQLFQSLRNNGWNVAASLDISRHSDKWTFVFHEETCGSGNRSGSSGGKSSITRDRAPFGQHSTESPNRPDGGRVWCACMSGQSTVTIINARQDLRQTMCEIANQYWPPGVKNVVEFGGNRRIRLVGQPWCPSAYQQPSYDRDGAIKHRQNEDLLARSLLCILLSELRENFFCHSLCTASVTWRTAASDKIQLSDAHCTWYFVDLEAEADSSEADSAKNGTLTAPVDAASKRRSTIC